MPAVDPPKLKLKFTNNKPPDQESSNSPAPPSAIRTPSIKLHIKPSPGLQSREAPPTAQKKKSRKKDSTVNDITPSSSGRKRKQQDDNDGSEDELARKPVQVRKLTLTTKPPAVQSPITPTLKLKYKGRVPKRPLGLGYDSELEEREADPTVLESFILRMPPGPDCDYLRDAVEHGTIGVARSQGGADVQMKFFERSGRRGVVTIRGQKWAAALVDLPCIVEGMKSWDKKAWVKGADICQMLLVLGQVQTEDQAKDFSLPDEVNPQTWQYAHGLTPPMKWARKRRFARTSRTSVNAIEAVERKVNQLLADDELAVHTKFELLDRDPAARSTPDFNPGDSDDEGGQRYNEDEDAEGEEDVGEFFGQENGIADSVAVETPTVVEYPPHQEDQDADDDFILSGLMETSDQPLAAVSDQTGANGHPLPSADSSFNIISTSPSVAETMAQTPVAVDNPRPDDESDDLDDDEDEEEDEEEEGDESMDDEDREATAQKQKALDEIQELKEELKKQMLLLKSQQNPILARKIRARIEQIQGDLETARKTAGVDGGDEDGEDD